jgi:hypothetical protein
MRYPFDITIIFVLHKPERDSRYMELTVESAASTFLDQDRVEAFIP